MYMGAYAFFGNLMPPFGHSLEHQRKGGTAKLLHTTATLTGAPTLDLRSTVERLILQALHDRTLIQSAALRFCRTAGFRRSSLGLTLAESR